MGKFLADYGGDKLVTFVVQPQAVPYAPRRDVASGLAGRTAGTCVDPPAGCATGNLRPGGLAPARGG